jgi:hypothetical protein
VRGLLFCLLFCVLVPGIAGGQTMVTVDATKQLGEVPRQLFGTGLRPNMQSDEAVVDFVRKTGLTVFRYPDSRDGGYRWRWPEGVMVRRSKSSVSALGRLDGAIDFAKRAGGELVFTVRTGDGSTAAEAAEVVRQASARGIRGAYWCLGNEPYFDLPSWSRDKYIAMVRSFAPAIKQVDPTARVGIAWGGLYVDRRDEGRNAAILLATRHLVDFADVHLYPGRPEKNSDPWEPLKIAAGAQQLDREITYLKTIVRDAAGPRADQFELHIWEWNGPNHPRCGGMQRLATAIFGADALGVMARHGIQLACQYNLQEHYCGLIPGYAREWPDGYGTQPWNQVTVRPLAYAIQLWSHHMGPKLVACRVTGSNEFEVGDWHTLVNFQGKVPYVAAHATQSRDESTLGLMLINKHPNADLDVTVRLTGFQPEPAATRRAITGPDYLAHNDDEKRGFYSLTDPPEPRVSLAESIYPFASAEFVVRLPKHSVTHLELKRR